MHKKLTAFFMCSLLTLVCLYAVSEASSLPDDKIFDSAKKALVLMSEKKYDQAIDVLCAKSWITASDMKSTIDSHCRHLYGLKVQTTYAVSWSSGEEIYLSVPLEEPSDGYISALLLTLDSSQHFDSLSFVHWSEIDSALRMSSAVRWCKEYKPSYRIFVD